MDIVRPLATKAEQCPRPPKTWRQTSSALAEPPNSLTAADRDHGEIPSDDPCRSAVSPWAAGSAALLSIRWRPSTPDAAAVQIPLDAFLSYNKTRPDESRPS